MIFKHLFRPKYQDPNPGVRIEAIASLNPDDNAQRARLRELAFNDESTAVNLAALERLNSFALWSKMADTAKNDKVRRKAQVIVEQALKNEHELILTEEEKLTFLRESGNNTLLERLLRHYIDSHNDTLIQTILSKLNKQHINRKVLLGNASESLQLALIRDPGFGVTDDATLVKLLKRTSHPTVAREAQAMLEQAQQEKQRPLEVEKNATLILSQLLALKDNLDANEVKAQRNSLQGAYQLLHQDFSCLDESTRQRLQTKYHDIQQKLDSWTEQLEIHWQHTRQKDISSELSELERQLQHTIETVSHSLSEDASSITLGEVEHYETELQQLEQALTAIAATLTRDNTQARQSIEQMFNGLHKCRNTLESLPAFQHAVEKAREFLDRFAAQPLPQDCSGVKAYEDYIKQQHRHWKECQGDYQSIWPVELSARYKLLKHTWQEAIDKLKETNRQEVNKLNSKLRAIESMITKGRFKPAMSLFKKTQVMFDMLPDDSQARLRRRFNKIQDAIANLKGWQEYIAGPRKPELLAEAQLLASSPLAVELQAEQVKALRQQWNSIGKLDTDEDEQLNEQFEAALEQAFAPCRQYFAERERIREQNLAAKHELLDEFEALSKQETADEELVQAFRALQKRWRDIGEVNYKELEPLTQRYQVVIAPISERVRQYQEYNAEQKRTLIKRAAALVEEEQLSDAISKAKSLQEQWKAVPASNRKLDDQLWKDFRRVNDQLFARRDQQRIQSQQQQSELTDSLDGMLEDANQQLQKAQSKVDLHEALAKEEDYFSKLKSLAPRMTEKYQKKWQSLRQKQNTRISQLNKTQQAEQRELFINILRNWHADTLPDEVKQLGNRYQALFASSQAGAQKSAYKDLSAQQLVIMLEIINDVPSPQADQSERKALQLKLMAEKLEQGEVTDEATLLKAFVSRGPFTQTQQSLIERLERILKK